MAAIPIQESDRYGAVFYRPQEQYYIAAFFWLSIAQVVLFLRLRSMGTRILRGASKQFNKPGWKDVHNYLLGAVAEVESNSEVAFDHFAKSVFYSPSYTFVSSILHSLAAPKLRSFDITKRATYKQAATFYDAGKVEHAKALLACLMVADRVDSNALLLSGVCLLGEDENRLAIIRFMQCIEYDNSNYWAHYYIGTILERDGYVLDAYSQFYKARELHSNIHGKVFRPAQQKIDAFPDVIVKERPRLTSYQSELFGMLFVGIIIIIGGNVFGYLSDSSGIKGIATSLAILWWAGGVIYLFLVAITSNVVIKKDGIQIARGIFNKRKYWLWHYNYSSPDALDRPFFWNILTGDAGIMLKPKLTEGLIKELEDSGGYVRITGLGDWHRMEKIHLFLLYVNRDFQRRWTPISIENP